MEWPFGLPHDAGDRQAVVLRQILRLARHAETFEVRRSGRDDAFQFTDATRSEVGVAQGADTDRQVDARLDEVDRILADHEIQSDLGIARHEFRQCGHQRVGSESGPDAHPNASARLLAEAHHVGLDVLDIADDALHALEIDLALGCQREATR